MQERIGKLKEERAKLQKEIREKTVGYIVAAFGLVAGLAWNEAVKAAIEFVFPHSTDSLFAKFLYAAMVTLIVVVISVYLVRLTKKEEA